MFCGCSGLTAGRSGSAVLVRRHQVAEEDARSDEAKRVILYEPDWRGPYEPPPPEAQTELDSAGENLGRADEAYAKSDVEIVRTDNGETDGGASNWDGFNQSDAEAAPPPELEPSDYTETLFMRIPGFANEIRLHGNDRIIFTRAFESEIENGILHEQYLCEAVFGDDEGDPAEIVKLCHIGSYRTYVRNGRTRFEYFDNMRGYAFVDGGRLLTLNENQSAKTRFDLYNDKYELVLSAEAPSNTLGRQEISYACIGETVFISKDGKKLRAYDVSTGKSIRLPEAFSFEFVKAFAIDESGIMHVVGNKNETGSNEIYYQIDVAAETILTSFDMFNAYGIIYLAVNGADGLPYIAWSNGVFKITPGAFEWESILWLGAETRRTMRGVGAKLENGFYGFYFAEGFFFDKSGAMCIAFYDEANDTTNIYKYAKASK